MKTFAGVPVCLLLATSLVWKFPLAANCQTPPPNLVVDQAYGNNPYTNSTGATFNNVTVGQVTQGVFTQRVGTGISIQGQLVLGDLPGTGSSGEFYIGSSTSSGAARSILQVSSMVIGNGGQGTFYQNAGAQIQVLGTLTLQATTNSSSGAYYLGGSSSNNDYLDVEQIGQNTGTTTSGTFYFYGGSLLAGENNPTFMQGLTAAYVYNTATINSLAYNIIIAQPLLNDVYGTDGGLTKEGTGTLTLTGNSTYTGPTTLNAGVLNAGSAAALGNSGSILFGGGTLQYSAASSGTDYSARFSPAANQPINLDTNGQSVTLGSAIAGNGTSLTKLGTGTLTLTGANAYTGPTAINAGVLNAGSASALGNGGALTFGGGTLQYSAASSGVDFSSRFTSTANQPISLDTNGQNVTIGFGFGGNGTSLTKLGSGTLTISGGNTYTGATNLNRGTVVVNNQNALGSGTISFGNGTLQYGDTTRTDDQYNAADFSARFSKADNQNYAVNTNGHNIVYQTALTSNGGTLLKTGPGTLTLNGNNTYSGSTKIPMGTLLLNGTNTGGGDVSVDNAGTVLGGSGSTTAAVRVSGGTINPGGNGGVAGSSAVVGKLGVGSLTLSNTSVLTFDLNSATLYDLLTSGGDVSLGNATLSLNVNSNASFNSGQILDLVHLTSGSLSQTFAGIANGGVYNFGGTNFKAVYTPTDFDLMVVPEPATSLAGALLCGLAGLRWVDRRRGHRKARL